MSLGDYAVAVLMGRKHSNPQEVINELKADRDSLHRRLHVIKNHLSSPSLNDTGKVVNFSAVRMKALMAKYTNNGSVKLTSEQRKEVHLLGLACNEYMKMLIMARRDIGSLTSIMQSFAEAAESGKGISAEQKDKVKLLRQYAKVAAEIISDNALNCDESFNVFFAKRIVELRGAVKYEAEAAKKGVARINASTVPPFYPLDIAAINTNVWKDSSTYDSGLHRLSNVVAENFATFSDSLDYY
jgi:hypothetical protein